MDKRRGLLLRKKLQLLKLLLLEDQETNKRYKKRFWLRQLYQARKEKVEFTLLVNDLRLFDQELFFRYSRMLPSNFETFLSWVAPRISKQQTKMREPICERERLCVTLRYLVTGDAQVTIAANYRMSPTVVGRIISETCEAIWDALNDEGYMKPPNSEDEWKKIAKDFKMKWNFPNALDAIDGKHVVIQAPARSGSSFFNYKKQHSIVLMAVCSALHRFLLVEIGDHGRPSDGSHYHNSNLGYAIENNLLNGPQSSKLPNSESVMPYVFVGDDAFGLKPHIMKPYPLQNLPVDKRVYNYRLSRALRVMENVFGIVASRFRIFRRQVIGLVDKVVVITKAVVALHNFLMSLSTTENNYSYCQSGYVDRKTLEGLVPGEWRKDTESLTGLQDLSQNGPNNYSKQAAAIRDEFKRYFNNEGAVDWHWSIVTNTGRN